MWISVHDSVRGPKLRTLANLLDVPIGEALGILNFLWLWGLQNADQYGNVMSADEIYLGNYLRNENGDYHLMPENIISALVESKWMDKDKGILVIHDWDEWQKEWYRYLKKLEVDRESKRRRRRTEAKHENNALPQNTLAKDEIVHLENKVPEAVQKEKAKTSAKSGKKPEYSESFRALWEVYPRKDDKSLAYKKYNERLKEGYSEAELLGAVKAYADEMTKKQQPKEYILMGKRFFECDGRFVRYIPSTVKDEDIINIKEEPSKNPFSNYAES